MEAYYQKGITMQFNKTIDLLSIGNTIVDLEYRVTEEKLNALSVEKGSMTLIEKPAKDELLATLGSPVHQCSGGSTANSIYVASLFGISTGHVGVIGQDDLGAFTKTDYKNSTISTAFETTTVNGDTACCIVLITPDGERSMLTYLGESANFPTGHYINDMITSSRCVFIEGYLVASDHAFELIKSTILPVAAAANTAIAFTLSDAGLVSFFNDRFMTILDHGVDYLFSNLNEAKTISKASNLDDIMIALSRFSNEVIVTDGSTGAYSFTDNTTTVHPTVALTAIDTTGAGDAFAGTYLAQRLTDIAIDTAGKKANELAGTVISNYGARPAELTHHFSA